MYFCPERSVLHTTMRNDSLHASKKGHRRGSDAVKKSQKRGDLQNGRHAVGGVTEDEAS